MKKIILHACCAPCASYPIIKLKEDGYEPVAFFYNPNIFPYSEYKIRRDELVRYCADLGVEYFEGEYDTKNFYQKIKGYEKEPERGRRCSLCFDLRLNKTAEFAKEKGIDCFTTTLTISPHKNSNQIFDIAHVIEKAQNVEFIEYNFKKNEGFKISRKLSENMYKQTYCGCEFSR